MSPDPNSAGARAEPTPPTRIRLAVGLGVVGAIAWFATGLTWIKYDMLGVLQTLRGYESRGSTMWIGGIPGGWITGICALLAIAGAIQVGRNMESGQARIWGLIAVVAGLVLTVLPVAELIHARRDFDTTYAGLYRGAIEAGFIDAPGSGIPVPAMGLGGWITTLAGLGLIVVGVVTTIVVNREEPSRWKAPRT